MAKLTGDIVRLNTAEAVFHAVGQAVMVMQDDKVVASGVVDDDDRFEIEVPAGVRGEIEVRLGLHHTAPSLAVIEDDDVHVSLIYNNQQHYA